MITGQLYLDVVEIEPLKVTLNGIDQLISNPNFSDSTRKEILRFVTDVALNGRIDAEKLMEMPSAEVISLLARISCNSKNNIGSGISDLISRSRSLREQADITFLLAKQAQESFARVAKAHRKLFPD